LIRHGLHRERRFQQVFVVAGTSLPSRYLAMIGGYTDRPTDTRIQQFLYCCVYSLSWERVYRAVAYQRKEGYTYRKTDWWGEGGIYEVRRWDGLRCHGIHTKFHKDWFRHSKVNRGDSQTQRQHGDHIRLY
jgi:hypothetical protein